MKLKCPSPSCGNLMADREPYRVLGRVGVAGFMSRCDCGCTIDEPTEAVR